MRLSSLVVLVLVLVTAAAQAQQPKSVGVIGEDDRKPLMSLDPPWDAVGKIQAAGYNWVESCTGTLVAPDRVVTAAHCLVDPRMKKPIPASKLNFLAGLRRDKWVGHAKVTCAKALRPLVSHDGTSAMLRTDVAVLVLEDVLEIKPMALAEDGALTAGSKVDHAGYAKNRPFVPSLHADCRVLAVDEGFIATDCDATFGQSGGPVLVKNEDGEKLAAVMVGGREDTANLAVAVENWRELAEEADCR